MSTIRKVQNMNPKQATVKFFRNHNHGAPILRRVCHKRNVAVRATEFVEACELVPRKWDNWFWVAISENAPFSFGDNNRTLIDAQFFASHCEDVLANLNDAESTTVGAKREWLKKVRRLGQMYIDLEN